MLDLKLQDKIPCSEIGRRAKIIDIIEYTLKQKWKWAGHIARMKDNRWTKRCTEWQPRRGKRSRGRPSRRWQDDITVREGTTWIRKATDRHQWKTLMEGYILQWWMKPRRRQKKLLEEYFLIQMSKVWIYVLSCVCPTGWPAVIHLSVLHPSCMTKTFILGNECKFNQVLSYQPYLWAPLTSTILYRFQWPWTW